jgi:hypothetical protein
LTHVIEMTFEYIHNIILSGNLYGILESQFSHSACAVRLLYFSYAGLQWGS